MEYFENEGLRLKVERGNRVFPTTDKSSDVINTLKKSLKRLGVNIVYNTLASDIVVKDGTVKGIQLDNGKIIYCDSVILATGGVSYPITGSDGQGMKMLEKYGHTLSELRPALVPMNIREEYAKDLQGLSLKNVEVSYYRTLKNSKKPIYSEFGEMLFTHFGVSGPVVLSASSIIGKYLSDENIIMEIDLKPALTKEQLDARILREFEVCANKDFRNSLDTLLPKKLIPVIIDYCKINPYKKVNILSKEEREKLIEAMKSFKMTVTSLRGFNEAIITQGGVKVKEINPTTMESKLVKNLFIVGEMLDVDALTGGYNLQIAWSTGNLAGKSIEL
jgi:predicted Rossmann fold flavoprotein